MTQKPRRVCVLRRVARFCAVTRTRDIRFRGSVSGTSRAKAGVYAGYRICSEWRYESFTFEAVLAGKHRRPKGEGSIIHRADGRWAYVVDFGKDRAGKRSRRTVYAATRAELMRRVADARVVGGGTMRARQPGSVREFLETWLRDDVKPNRAVSTYAGYEGALRKHVYPLVAGLKLDAFDSAAASALYARLHEGASPASILDRIAVALHRAFSMREQRSGAPNPFARTRGVERPRYRVGEVKVLTTSEVARLLKEARGSKDRLETLWAVLGSTGLRVGEALGLQWSDVDEHARTLSVRRALTEVGGVIEVGEPKTARSKRTIPLPPIAVEALARRRKAHDREGHGSPFVFTTGKGTHPRRSPLRRDSFKPLLIAAKLPHVSIHSPRHSVASTLAANGIDVQTIMQILGQSRPGVTLTHYVHSSPETQRRAMDRLGDVLKNAKAKASRKAQGAH